jgi:hypothetical protein
MAVAPLPSERKHWWLTNRKVGSLPFSLSHIRTSARTQAHASSILVWVIFFGFVFLAMLKSEYLSFLG